jgi:hypothetical protein
MMMKMPWLRRQASSRAAAVPNADMQRFSGSGNDTPISQLSTSLDSAGSAERSIPALFDQSAKKMVRTCARTAQTEETVF